MFGVPLATLIALAVKYGPAAIDFVREIDPLVHQIVIDAAPLAAKVQKTFGAADKVAATHSVFLLRMNTTQWTDAEWKNYWDRASDGGQ